MRKEYFSSRFIEPGRALRAPMFGMTDANRLQSLNVMTPTESPVNDPFPAEKRQIDDAWIGEHYPRVHRAAWLMTGDPCAAEDLAQETFVVALDRWHAFEGRSAETTWLYGILIRLDKHRRRTLSRMRRRLKQYIERGDHLRPRTESDLDPSAQLALQQWRDSVWADVAALPRLQREAVMLRFAEEMSYQGIAATLRCPVGTAKTRVHHGLKQLRIQCSDLRLDEIPNESSTTPDCIRHEIQLSTRT